MITELLGRFFLHCLKFAPTRNRVGTAECWRYKTLAEVDKDNAGFIEEKLFELNQRISDLDSFARLNGKCLEDKIQNNYQETHDQFDADAAAIQEVFALLESRISALESRKPVKRGKKTNRGVKP